MTAVICQARMEQFLDYNDRQLQRVWFQAKFLLYNVSCWFQSNIVGSFALVKLWLLLQVWLQPLISHLEIWYQCSLLIWLYHLMPKVVFLHLQHLNLLAAIHHVKSSLMEFSSYFCFFPEVFTPIPQWCYSIRMYTIMQNFIVFAFLNRRMPARKSLQQTSETYW